MDAQCSDGKVEPAQEGGAIRAISNRISCLCFMNFHRFDFVSLLFFMDKTVKTIPRPLHSNFIQFAYRSVVLTFLDFTLQHREREEDGKRRIQWDYPLPR